MIRFPPKKILVAFDLSDVSRTAWKHAVVLAASCEASLEVVYVEPWQLSVDLMPPPDLPAEFIRGLQAKIRRITGDAAKVTILQGVPAQRVLAYSRLHRPDLIVVGTHGRTGLKRALLGSVAEAVIRGSAIPVLAARGPARAVSSILAPVNFTPYSDYGFAYAAAASAVLSAGLTALHVEDDPIWGGNPQYKLTRMLDRLPAAIREKCRPSLTAIDGDPVKGILKARRGHDWIVLVAHDKSMIKDAFFGTTLEQVLRRSTIPVLSVPAFGGAPFALKVSESAQSEKTLTLK